MRQTVSNQCSSRNPWSKRCHTTSSAQAQIQRRRAGLANRKCSRCFGGGRCRLWSKEWTDQWSQRCTDASWDRGIFLFLRIASQQVFKWFPARRSWGGPNLLYGATRQDVSHWTLHSCSPLNIHESSRQLSTFGSRWYYARLRISSFSCRRLGPGNCWCPRSCMGP